MEFDITDTRDVRRTTHDTVSAYSGHACKLWMQWKEKG